MSNSKKIDVRLLIIAALMLALAILLPQIFGRIQFLGTKFLPMHIPVLLCGFICGVRYGTLCGAVAPLMCSLLFGMPPFFPMAVSMAVELCAYGAAAGLARALIAYKPYKYKLALLYASLIGVMIIGRIAYGITMIIITAIQSEPYTFSVFISASAISAIPGIILQLILIPLILAFLSKTGVIKERYI